MADANDMTIDDAPVDAEVTGVELIPISDGGTAKSTTVGAVKQYTLKELAAVAAATETDVTTDGVYLLQGGTVKPISASKLADAILEVGVGGTATTAELSGEEAFVIKKAGAIATLTLKQIQEWVAANLTSDFDIKDLTTGDTENADDFVALSQTRNGETSMKKMSLDSVREWIVKSIFEVTTTSAAALESTDVLLVGKVASDGTITYNKIAFGATGIGDGDVKGPTAAVQDEEFARFDGTTGKVLKGGITLTEEVNDSSTSTSVPTAAAVNKAVAGKGNVFGPDETTEGKIPRWNAESKTLSDGIAVATSVSATSTDEELPTAKAVQTAVAAKGDVKAEGTTTEGKVPRWSATGKTLGDGMAVTTSVSAGSTDAQLPTAKAVETRFEETGDVKAPTAPTANAIPQWKSDGTKELTIGLSVATSVSSASTDTEIPTAKAVNAAIANQGGVTSEGTKTSGTLTAWDANGNLVDGKKVSDDLTKQTSSDYVPTAAAVIALVDDAQANYVQIQETEAPAIGEIVVGKGNNSALKTSGVKITATAPTSASADTTVPTSKAVKSAIDTAVADVPAVTTGSTAGNLVTYRTDGDLEAVVPMRAHGDETFDDSSVPTTYRMKEYADSRLNGVFLGKLDAAPTLEGYEAGARVVFGVKSGSTYKYWMGVNIGNSTLNEFVFCEMVTSIS